MLRLAFVSLSLAAFGLAANPENATTEVQGASKPDDVINAGDVLDNIVMGAGFTGGALAANAAIQRLRRKKKVAVPTSEKTAMPATEVPMAVSESALPSDTVPMPKQSSWNQGLSRIQSFAGFSSTSEKPVLRKQQSLHEILKESTKNFPTYDGLKENARTAYLDMHKSVKDSSKMLFESELATNVASNGAIKALSKGALAAAATAGSIGLVTQLAEAIRTRNITFIHPTAGEVFKIGESIPVATENYGLSSPFGYSRVNIHLISATENETPSIPVIISTSKQTVSTLASTYLGKIERSSFYQPTKSSSNVSVPIPTDIPTGEYKLLLVYRGTRLTTFMTVSPVFLIVGADSNTVTNNSSSISPVNTIKSNVDSAVAPINDGKLVADLPAHLNATSAAAA